MNTRVYISGPITGIQHAEIPFLVAAERWEENGWNPINPAMLNEVMPKGATHEEYMKVCMLLLEMCDTIYMLKGWENSKGARMELEYAQAHGYKVYKEGERWNG